MPFLFNHVGLPLSDVQRPLVEPLSKHFRVVRYDSRGQGLSTRGLREGLLAEAYQRDLEAVADAFPGESLILIGGAFSAHVAVRYTAQYPKRVRALILLRAGVAGEVVVGPHFSLDLAQADWNFFLDAMVRTTRAAEATAPEHIQAGVERFRASMTQSDWLTFALAALKSNVSECLPQVQTPTLVVLEPDLRWPPPQGTARLASLIPDARLVSVSGPESRAAIVQAVLDFTALLPQAQTSHRVAREWEAAAAHSRLTPRELEALRLIAAGRTNREIATELVLSERTVARHIANLYGKIEARSRSEATAFAFKHNLT